MIRASTCLVNQRFQESNALQPNWRLALVHQATPKLPRINNKLLRRVCYEAIDLIVSAIDQRLNQESFSSYTQGYIMHIYRSQGYFAKHWTNLELESLSFITLITKFQSFMGFGSRLALCKIHLLHVHSRKTRALASRNCITKMCHSRLCLEV